MKYISVITPDYQRIVHLPDNVPYLITCQTCLIVHFTEELTMDLIIKLNKEQASFIMNNLLSPEFWTSIHIKIDECGNIQLEKDGDIDHFQNKQ